MRHLCLPLAFIILLLAACRGPDAPTPPNPGGKTIPANPTSIPTREPAAAVTTVPSTSTPLPRLEQPIIWYLRGESPVDLPKVNEQLNRILAERGFNARIELRVLPWSAFEQHMAGILAADEPWDLLSLSAASYPGWLENNSLLNLTAYPDITTISRENLLAVRAPRLSASLSEQAWVGISRAGGNVVPNPSAWVRPPGVSIRADVVRELNLQPELDQARTFTDLTPILAKIKAAVDDGTLKASRIANSEEIRRVAGQANLLQPENAGYDRLWGPFAVRYDDHQGKIIDWYRSAEFKDLAGLQQKWLQAGYLPEDSLSPDQVIEGYRAGRYVVEVSCPVWSGSALEQARRYGYEWIDRPLAPSFLRTEAILSSLTGVSARIAGDPERVYRVMLFLEWLHSDPEVYNLLAYGIEGQHWHWANHEKQVIALAPDSGYLPDFVNQLGDRDLSYATGPAEAGLWQAAAREDGQTPASVALGFIFDPRPVAAEAAAVRGLTPELLDPLATGQAIDVDKAIRGLQNSLDEVGLATVQAEMERQWLAWLVEQK